MFNMQHTAKLISSARKAQNMTQLELADQLGVSFQAISNWERGVSMPDIAKLPDVSRLLGLPIDELLGESSSLVEGLLSEEGDAYLENAEISPQELSTAAPVLKPDQFKTAFEHTDPPIEFSGDISELSPLLPFIDEEGIDQLAEKAYEKNGISVLSSILPFMSTARIDAIAKQECQKNGIETLTSLFPFISSKCLDMLAEQEYEKTGIEHIASVAPFLSQGTLDSIAKKVILSQGLSAITSIAPFISNDLIQQILGER